MNNVMHLPANRFLDGTCLPGKYRPCYPDLIISYLEQIIGLKKRFRIADICSGSGIFSELLLKHGYRVKGIEANDEMRMAAEKRLDRFSGFSSINGTPGETGIKDQTIDLIIVAQAFHCFKPIAVKKEFSRILKPPGHTLLVWNVLQDNTPFLTAYYALIEKYSPGLKHTRQANISSIHAFFRPAQVTTTEFQHTQLLNHEDLKGYLLSHVLPFPDDHSYSTMMEELDQLFQQYSDNDFVKMEYKTKLDLSAIQ